MAAVAAGAAPVEVTEVDDDRVALAAVGETATEVAFDRLPRRHILESWLTLGVKVLKTIRNESERSAGQVRREAGFLAFAEGADGLWIPEEGKMPENFRTALKRGRRDREILDYLVSLRDKAAASESADIAVEARRVDSFFASLPADWEDLDALRLETVAWAKRLEQLLGETPRDLPTDCEPAIEPDAVPFRPFADLGVEPSAVDLGSIAGTPGINGIRTAVKDLGEGLSVEVSDLSFTLVWTDTNSPPVRAESVPGGAMDFRLYLPGKKSGAWLPYRYHVDLEPICRGPRAPCRERLNFLMTTGERFRPYDLPSEEWRRTAFAWPRLRTFGEDYPDLKPEVQVCTNACGRGFAVRLSVSWANLYGHWPAMNRKSKVAWHVGVVRAPNLSRPVARKIVFPTGNPEKTFDRFSRSLANWRISGLYKTELARTRDVWTASEEDRYYPLLKTKEPSFNRGDRESDAIFWTRLGLPLAEKNDNAWEILWTDRDHKSTFDRQPPDVRRKILLGLDKLLFLSQRVGKLRRDYLRDRFRGKLPPEPKPRAKPKDAAKGPSLDSEDGGGSDGLELDEKEF